MIFFIRYLLKVPPHEVRNVDYSGLFFFIFYFNFKPPPPPGPHNTGTRPMYESCLLHTYLVYTP